MPASKKTAATASANGRAIAAGAKAPSARAAKRAAPSKATAAKTAKAVRGAPKAPESYAATTWGGDNHFELTTPSGQKCLARNLDIEELMEMGLLDAVNGLSGIIDMEVLPKAQGQPQVDMSKIMNNGAALSQVLSLVNSIVCAGVVAPEIHPIIDPETGERVAKQVGLVYVDSIPVADRFFLFNELAGGLDQLAAFH